MSHGKLGKLALPAISIVLTLLVFAVTSPETADAHSSQINSNPAPGSELEAAPGRVIVWFSVPVESSFSEVRVLNSDGRQVDLQDSAVDLSAPTALSVGLPPLENGTYTVVWKNLSSVDGHTATGSFVFAVGEPLAAVSGTEVAGQPLLQTPADPWLRWLVFLGAAIVIGGLTFELFIGVPVVYGPDARDSWQATGPVASSRWWRFASAGIVVLVAAMLGQLFQQVSALAGSTELRPGIEAVRFIAFESGWGRLWTYRLVAVVGIGVLLLIARRVSRVGDWDPDDRDENMDSRGPTLIGDSLAAQAAAVLGLVFLGLVAAGSNNAASPAEIKMFAIATDFAHLTAATVWLGGVFYLATSVPGAIRESGSRSAPGLFRAMVPRFTVLSLLSAGILVITGIFSSYMQVTVPAAVQTPYGWFLVGKLALVVALFVFAARNGLQLAMRYGRSVGSGEGEARSERSVLAQAVVAVLVFGAAGWLASLEPARQYSSGQGVVTPDTDTSIMLFGLEVAVIGLLVLAVGFRGRLAPAIFGATQGQRGFLVPGVVLAAIGTVLVLNVQVSRVGLAEDLRNPYPPTANSVAAGEPIYASACALCHGIGGLGDGPAAGGLPKPASDLFVHVLLHSDTMLFKLIRDGIGQSGMPGQVENLTEQQMWYLVSYLRSAFDNR